MEAIQWTLIVYLILFTEFFSRPVCLDNSFFLPEIVNVLVFQRSRTVLKEKSNLSMLNFDLSAQLTTDRG